MKKTMADIDGGKLLRALEVRGLVPSQVSREMGFSDTHISQAVQRGCINMPSVKLLETMFNIPYSEYEYVEPEPIKREAVTVAEPNDDPLPWCDGKCTYEPKRMLTGEDIEELVKAFRGMVYEETKKAFEEVLAK